MVTDLNPDDAAVYDETVSRERRQCRILHVMDLRDYARLDATAIAELIRNGDVSVADVTESAIRAIESLNPQLNAVVTKNFDACRDRTEFGSSSLSGVPLLLKDCNVYSSDMPTTYSCEYFSDAKPKPDSTIVARWRNAGLNILGKTNLPEFAGEFVTEPRWRGICRNPWNPDLTTGGSSGGAAAAVASGMVPIAHATDLGGSIRIPAACCGIYGLKPTVGLNPTGPFAEIASGLNSDHVLTRSVRDSAASLDISNGADTATRYHVSSRVNSFVDALTETPPRLNIGYTTLAPDGSSIQARHAEAVRNTVDLLKAHGHTCIPFNFPSGVEIGEWFEALWVVDVIAAIDDHKRSKGRPPASGELEPLTQAFLDQVAGLSAGDFQACRLKATEVAQTLNAAQQDIDLLLTPALASDPPSVGSISGRSGDQVDLHRWAQLGYGFAPFSAPFNLTGQPAAVCPLNWNDSEMPLAVQIVGRHGEDHVVLQISLQIEQEFSPNRPQPTLGAGSLPNT